jgi:hypothetical protein
MDLSCKMSSGFLGPGLRDENPRKHKEKKEKNQPCGSQNGFAGGSMRGDATQKMTATNPTRTPVSSCSTVVPNGSRRKNRY